MSEKRIENDIELEKWAGRVQFLLGILGGGGVIGLLITFSELELCKRIFIVIAIIACTLALIIFLRLWVKAKNRRIIEVPNRPTPSLAKYLAQNARSLLLSEIAFIAVFILCSFLFVFPETMNALPICASPTPSITPTPTPDCITIKLELNVTGVDAEVKVRADEKVIFEGTAIKGIINICVPYSYNGKQIDLSVTAEGYSPYTKSLLAEPNIPPQSINLQPSNCSYHMNNGQGGIDTITFSGCSAAKIRIEMNKKAMPGYGYSLWEVEAYKSTCSSISGATDLNIGGKAIASSVENGAVALYKPNHAIDGYMDTRWASEFSDPQWLEIELPTSQAGTSVQCIVLKWEAAFAVDYSVTIVP
jgi:hypothetical protein